MNNESLTTTDANTPSDSDNQGKASDSETVPESLESTRTDNVNAFSDQSDSQDKSGVDSGTRNLPIGGPVESHLSANLEQTENNNGVNVTSGRKESENTNDSTSSHAHNQEEIKSNENISPDDNQSKTKVKSTIGSNVDESVRSNISTIPYDTDEADLLAPILTNAADKKLIDRLLGCAYGQALGDAYGLSTEFEDRYDVDRNYGSAKKLIPFPGYKLTNHNRRWPRGDWTDDTDQWLLILDTLVYNNGDEKVFANKLKEWIYHGYPELGDHGGMGLGANVSQVILFLSESLRHRSKEE